MISYIFSNVHLTQIKSLERKLTFLTFGLHDMKPYTEKVKLTLLLCRVEELLYGALEKRKEKKH